PGHAIVGESSTSGRSASGFGDLDGRVLHIADEFIGNSVPVEASQCADQVFGGGVATVGVTALHRGSFDVFGERRDVGRCDLVNRSFPPNAATLGSSMACRP
ncbi:MAG: hypothetical protein ABIQ18_38080, partial [Umezawaea sp.]